MSKEMICCWCGEKMMYSVLGQNLTSSHFCDNVDCKAFQMVLPDFLWKDIFVWKQSHESLVRSEQSADREIHRLRDLLSQSQRDLQDKKEELEEFKKHHAMWEQIRNNTILALEKDLQIAVGTLRSIGACNNRVSNLALQKMAHNALAQINHDNKDE